MRWRERCSGSSPIRAPTSPRRRCAHGSNDWCAPCPSRDGNAFVDSAQSETTKERCVETVAFTSMAEGTAEDYELLGRYEKEYVAALPDRLLSALDGLKHSLAGYQVSRYEHSLQSATRALRDERSEEYVVAALLHDLGDELAPYTHGEMVAAILKPYVSEEICWAVKHHGLFQTY